MYILVFFIYSSTCTLHEITNFECPVERIEYTDLIVKTMSQCAKLATHPKIRQTINENYTNVWVIPHCQTYTREVETRIKYYIEGI